jgi:hypothetical protein
MKKVTWKEKNRDSIECIHLPRAIRSYKQTKFIPYDRSIASYNAISPQRAI